MDTKWVARDRMTPTKTNQGSLEQRTPAFFVPGTWFLMEEIFSQTGSGGGVRVQDDSSTLPLLGTLFLLL